ncbi:hypothetical protein [Conexibacter sp. CPCC 206217]|uniref:hypothetical protein n=1 Tax=Conexibacter sp. CPCC 206217 TaxID=3064574 RepID=UPI00271B6124|nr:hypothetical protein [Conexibacter sp. CPCC 206217]MDO8209581.1 hypothetical protein [Conexibacter sp. CPCC 206217]
MSALRRFRRGGLTAIVAAGLLAATATGAQASSGTVDGLRLTSCPGDLATDVGLFRHGLSCGRALRLAASAADSDRWCPAGWRHRTGVRMAGVNPRRSGYPALTLCSRKTSGDGRQAFTYFLPNG